MRFAVSKNDAVCGFWPILYSVYGFWPFLYSVYGFCPISNAVCGIWKNKEVFNWSASYFNIQFRSRHLTAIIDGSGDNLVERRNVLKKMAVVAIDIISIDVTEF